MFPNAFLDGWVIKPFWAMSLRPRPTSGYACNIVLTKGCVLLVASWCVQDMEEFDHGPFAYHFWTFWTFGGLIQKSCFLQIWGHIPTKFTHPKKYDKTSYCTHNNGRCFPFTTGNTIFNPEFISLKPACWFTRYVETQPRSAGEISHWRVSNPFRHRAGRAPATLGEVGCFCVELEDRNGSYLGCNLWRKTDFFSLQV